MARKTKSELLAEREEEYQARLVVAKATYVERMMSVLERATNENFDLKVSDGQFLVDDRDERRSAYHRVQPVWSETADMDLYSLEVCVELKEEKRLEAERKANLRSSALSKLTEEEREALGL